MDLYPLSGCMDRYSRYIDRKQHNRPPHMLGRQRPWLWREVVREQWGMQCQTKYKNLIHTNCSIGNVWPFLCSLIILLPSCLHYFCFIYFFSNLQKVPYAWVIPEVSWILWHLVYFETLNAGVTLTLILYSQLPVSEKYPYQTISLTKAGIDWQLFPLCLNCVRKDMIWIKIIGKERKIIERYKTKIGGRFNAYFCINF